MRTETARPRPTVARTEVSKPSEDRTGYRRTPGGPGADKKADVGAGTADLEFVSNKIKFQCFVFNLILLL